MGDDVHGRALEQALSRMTAGPMPLHAIVAAFLMASGRTIAPEEIPGLILDSDPNDPGRIHFYQGSRHCWRKWFQPEQFLSDRGLAWPRNSALQQWPVHPCQYRA